MPASPRAESVPPRATTAVVPLRDGSSGKSRLSAALDPASRSRLVAVLARHVVETLLSADGVERVLVVTAEPPFARASLGELADQVEIVAQPTERPGLNAALDFGREQVLDAARGAGHGSARLLVAHADLPALTSEDVAAILRDDAPVVLATDRAATGTNLLALDLGRELDGSEAFRFRFGVGSLAAHRGEADRLGLASAVVQRPGTAVDLDTLDDWAELPAEVRERVHREVPDLA